MSASNAPCGPRPALRFLRKENRAECAIAGWLLADGEENVALFVKSSAAATDAAQFRTKYGRPRPCRTN